MAKGKTQLRLKLRRKPRRRRRTHGKRPVPHRSRERFTRRSVFHVRLRIRSSVPRLRSKRYVRALAYAFATGCIKPGFSICQFSIQGNHIHIILEADNHECLSRGMQGFGVRAAKAINRAAGRKGSVFAERYAETRIRQPKQLRGTLCYVLHNARRHGAKFRGADPYSSARYFDGWKRQPKLPPSERPGSPVAPAKTPLLRKRWRYYGLIDPDEMPAAGRT